MKIKRNDIVKVMAGKDKHKTGKVLKIFPTKNKALVEGVNYLKKHSRKSQDNPQGGIVQKESPINISNLAIICTRCGNPSRIKFSVLPDKTKVRVCSSCKETI
jgi:large subunit ribosomal protein L24